jgi:hypothetical protein
MAERQEEVASKMSRFRRLAPFFVFGPVSGPLLAGVVFNLRGGRPFLAGLYAVALVEFTFGLPYLIARLGLNDYLILSGR